MFAGILEVQVPTSVQNRLEQKDNIFTEKRLVQECLYPWFPHMVIEGLVFSYLPAFA